MERFFQMVERKPFLNFYFCGRNLPHFVHIAALHSPGLKEEDLYFKAFLYLRGGGGKVFSNK